MTEGFTVKRLLTWAVATGVALMLPVGAAMALAGSGHSSAAGEKIVLKKTGKLGKILRDSEGHVVYLFEKDKTTKSQCYNACATNWPPVITKGKPVAGSGIVKSKLSTTKRKDGKKQVTYGGHPLYYFVGDSKAGQANGEGLDAFGAEWYVLSKSGKKVDK
jgi:predicted lipoprotein with Yx(FWY)xxD motif